MISEDGTAWLPDTVEDGNRWTTKYCERCQVQAASETGCEILASLVAEQYRPEVVAVGRRWGTCLNFSNVVGNNYP
jgi:hypothetical protein